jgi:hypothetical protein
VQHRERRIAAVDGFEDRPRRGSGAFERPCPLRRVDDGGLEQLAHDAERKLSLELTVAGREHAQSGLRRVASRLGDEARLADARGALHEREPRDPAGRPRTSSPREATSVSRSSRRIKTPRPRPRADDTNRLRVVQTNRRDVDA